MTRPTTTLRTVAVTLTLAGGLCGALAPATGAAFASARTHTAENGPHLVRIIRTTPQLLSPAAHSVPGSGLQRAAGPADDTRRPEGTRKLVLRKETLRELTRTDLRQVAKGPTTGIVLHTTT